MKFELSKAIEILRQTPYSLSRLLEDLSPEWVESEGNKNNWSPYDVIGHLIHAEETDWIPRAAIILERGDNPRFEPFDRLAQFKEAPARSLQDLLTEFAHLRNASLERLAGWQLSEDDLDLIGVHPEFGQVNLRQLLAAWAVHDLNHIRQVVTYLSRKYSDQVGPWKAYLSILQ